MAAILEDEDVIAQAQERERARLEEEARILAFQQQIQDAPPYELASPAPVPLNFMSQPQAEIDALQAQFNAQAQPTAFVPAVRESYTPDSAQYQAEVARAQRSSGFVNADIGPSGNVITPGYDPLKDFAALKAQQEATNLQRNQYVDSLIKGGATYAEAYRAGQGRHPQIGNDAMRLKVEQLALKQMGPLRGPLMQGEVFTINGVKMMRTGPNSLQRIPDTKTETATKAVMPPDAAASQKIITGQITDARADLQRAQKEIEKDRTNVDAVNAALRARGKLRGLEQSLVTGSTNWIGAAQAPIPVAPTTATPAQAQAVNEVRKLTKDGKVAVFDRKTEQFIRFE